MIYTRYPLSYVYMKKLLKFTLISLSILIIAVILIWNYFKYFVINHVIRVHIYSENIPEAFYSDMITLAGNNYISTGGGEAYDTSGVKIYTKSGAIFYKNRLEANKAKPDVESLIRKYNLNAKVDVDPQGM